jgi:hypothetical protein
MKPAAARPRPAWLAPAAPVNVAMLIGLVVVGITGRTLPDVINEVVPLVIRISLEPAVG